MDPVVFQYELPYLHPVVVHAPIALLLAAAGAAAAYAVAGGAPWRWAALILLGTGALGAWGARTTGEALEEAVEGDPMVEALIETHESAADWAWRTSMLGALAFAAATVWLHRRPERPDPPWLRWLLLVAPLAAALAVAYTAHVGGLMVWGVPR